MFRSTFNEETKLWNGANIPSVFDTNISIANILLKSMRTFGSKTAQVSVKSVPIKMCMCLKSFQLSKPMYSTCSESRSALIQVCA